MSENTTAGPYSINVTASGGSVSRTIAYDLTVQGAPQVKTLTFREGDGGPFSQTDDATIYSGNPNGTYGSDPLVIVDRGNCIANETMCRGLLSFPNFIGPDEGQVPSNAAVESATLEFNVTNPGPSQRLYQVQEAWTEATVTWNSFANPGTPNTKGPTIFYNVTLGRIVVNITGIVQNWVTGDANYGVFLQTDSWDGMHFHSSESVSPPTLTVTFRGVGSPRAASGSLNTPDAPSPAPTPWAVKGGFDMVDEIAPEGQAIAAVRRSRA